MAKGSSEPENMLARRAGRLNDAIKLGGDDRRIIKISNGAHSGSLQSVH